MMYEEKKQNLFDVPEDNILVQCISADFVMGAGIAVQFNRLFDTKNRLKARYGNRVSTWDSSDQGGECIADGRVYNLITKRNVWDKPTLQTMWTALCDLRRQVDAGGIKKIAMPLIGCGIDRLNWNDVSRLVMKAFEDTDVEITVCRI